MGTKQDRNSKGKAENIGHVLAKTLGLVSLVVFPTIFLTRAVKEGFWETILIMAVMYCWIALVVPLEGE